MSRQSVTAILPTVSRRTSVTLYDPEQGLKTIAVAEAGEKHWARAKDATQLLAAIETKIKAQAEYVVWRDGVPVTPHAGPGRGKKNHVAVLKRSLPEADPGDLTVHRWRKRLCTKNGAGTEIDLKKLERVLEDAGRRVVRICEQQNMGAIRGTEGTGEYERYTPAEYVEAAREVLGKIDLDPASSQRAQKTVKAAEYFAIEDDGLKQKWHGRVFLNAPYHRGLLAAFVDKLVAEITAGRVTSAVMLTNNCTDTDWFDTALRACAGVCFTHGRIQFFERGGTQMDTPPQGQAFFYFGPDVERFEDVFRRIGPCVRPSRHYEAAK